MIFTLHRLALRSDKGVRLQVVLLQASTEPVLTGKCIYIFRFSFKFTFLSYNLHFCNSLQNSDDTHSIGKFFETTPFIFTNPI